MWTFYLWFHRLTQLLMSLSAGAWSCDARSQVVWSSLIQPTQIRCNSASRLCSRLIINPRTFRPYSGQAKPQSAVGLLGRQFHALRLFVNGWSQPLFGTFIVTTPNVRNKLWSSILQSLLPQIGLRLTGSL